MPSPSRGPHRPRRLPPDRAGPPPSPRERFLATDAYRAGREWQRYEGTAQRDLFLELRLRFLRRYRADGGWAVDVGAGPGRFTEELATAPGRSVGLDLSAAMLRAGLQLAAPAPEVPRFRVRGDAARPPFAVGTFTVVALLGNVVGFAGAGGPRLLDSSEALVAPGGHLIVEIAPGAGEASDYLRRLPAGAVGRLLAAPPGVVVPRIEREGFYRLKERHASRGFDRWTVGRLRSRWAESGFVQVEAMAIAPVLGADPLRVEQVRHVPRAWERLLEVEEQVGRVPARWGAAAAVLVAARRPPLDGTIKTRP